MWLHSEAHNSVMLSGWRETWAFSFSKEKERILASMRESQHDAAVRHVGSTSIKGMIAKPIIDILICPAKDTPLKEIVEDLQRIGYVSLGECGRPGRIFLSKGDMPDETFYIHLCYEDNQVAKDQLLFQKIEATNPVVRENYMRMKIQLAEQFPDDWEMYRNLKGLYVEGVLSAYRQAIEEKQ